MKKLFKDAKAIQKKISENSEVLDGKLNVSVKKLKDIQQRQRKKATLFSSKLTQQIQELTTYSENNVNTWLENQDFGSVSREYDGWINFLTLENDEREEIKNLYQDYVTTYNTCQAYQETYEFFNKITEQMKLLTQMPSMRLVPMLSLQNKNDLLKDPMKKELDKKYKEYTSAYLNVEKAKEYIDKLKKLSELDSYQLEKILSDAKHVQKKLTQINQNLSKELAVSIGHVEKERLNHAKQVQKLLEEVEKLALKKETAKFDEVLTTIQKLLLSSFVKPTLRQKLVSVQKIVSAILEMSKFKEINFTTIKQVEKLLHDVQTISREEKFQPIQITKLFHGLQEQLTSNKNNFLVLREQAEEFTRLTELPSDVQDKYINVFHELGSVIGVNEFKSCDLKTLQKKSKDLKNSIKEWAQNLTSKYLEMIQEIADDTLLDPQTKQQLNISIKLMKQFSTISPEKLISKYAKVWEDENQLQSKNLENDAEMLILKALAHNTKLPKPLRRQLFLLTESYRIQVHPKQCCPISLTPLVNAVKISAHPVYHYFNAREIRNWITIRGKKAKNPLNNQPITHGNIEPAHEVRALIKACLDFDSRVDFCWFDGVHTDSVTLDNLCQVLKSRLRVTNDLSHTLDLKLLANRYVRAAKNAKFYKKWVWQCDELQDIKERIANGFYEAKESNTRLINYIDRAAKISDKIIRRKMDYVNRYSRKNRLRFMSALAMHLAQFAEEIGHFVDVMDYYRRKNNDTFDKEQFDELKNRVELIRSLVHIPAFFDNKNKEDAIRLAEEITHDTISHALKAFDYFQEFIDDDYYELKFPGKPPKPPNAMTATATEAVLVALEVETYQKQKTKVTNDICKLTVLVKEQLDLKEKEILEIVKEAFKLLLRKIKLVVKEREHTYNYNYNTVKETNKVKLYC